MGNFARVAGAFLRRDLAVAASYRLSLVLRVGAAVVTLATLALLARFVGTSGAGVGRYGEAGYLGFWLVGLAIAELFRVLSTTLGRKIREAQLEGTLEATLSTPAPTPHILLATPLAEVLLGLLGMVFLLGAGAPLLGVSFGPVNIPSLLLVFVLAVLAFSALGLLGGALTMLLRRTDPVTALVGVAAMLVGGVLFPVDVMPAPLPQLSYALPLAPALEGLRRALFSASPPGDLGPELAALGLFAAVVGPAAALLFRHALRRARADGSLNHY
jgi:ABC-2 type transport system permease protein